MKTITNVITILLFLSILLITFSNSYKLERYIEEKDWELIETEKDNIFKPVLVERREILFFRFLRSGNSDNSSSTESLSIKFEIHSKDIQETFYLFGLNNETSIRNIKDVELKDRKEETTPIRREACLDPVKPLYFSLSMFNYLWGGDLLFTIQENNSSYCINSMANVQKKKIDTSVLIATDKPQTETPSSTISINETVSPSPSVNNVTSSPSITSSESITPSPTIVQTITESPISNKTETKSNKQSIQIDSSSHDKPKVENVPVISNKQKIESENSETEKPIETNRKSLVEKSPAVESETSNS
ncbi:hypothetical protein ACTFIV_008157 [Dictyostelium citrinum]